MEIHQEPAASGFGVRQEERGNSTFAGGSGKVLGIAADSGDQIESGFGGCFAAGGMQRGAVFAHFKHLAGNENPAAGGARGQGANHRAERLGIGVIAVVENRRAADLDDLASFVAGGERLERGDGRIQIDARLDSNGEPGQDIRCVVRTQQIEGQLALKLPGPKAHMQAGKVFGGVKKLRIGARACAEVDGAAGKVAAKLGDIWIVAVEKSDAGRRQRLNQLEFCAGNAGLAVGEVFDVRGANVGDHAPVGRGDASQGGDLAGVVHAHLDDRDLVLGLEAQQLQRKPEGVVEIALRFEHVELCAEGRGNGLLGRGFSCRPGNSHHAAAPAAAEMRGEGLQSKKRVFCDKQRHGKHGVGQSSGPGARNNGGHGSALNCCGYKVMAV